MKNSPEFNFEGQDKKPLFSFKKKEKPDLSRFKKTEPSKAEREKSAEAFLNKQLRKEKRQARREAVKEKRAMQKEIAARFSDTGARNEAVAKSEVVAPDTVAAPVETVNESASLQAEEISNVQEQTEAQVADVITPEEAEAVALKDSEAQELVEQLKQGQQEIFDLTPERKVVAATPAETEAATNQEPVQFASAASEIEMSPAPKAEPLVMPPEEMEGIAMNEDMAQVQAIREQQEAQNEADKQDVMNKFKQMQNASENEDGTSENDTSGLEAAGAIEPNMS